jgi:hypothetical protein
MNTTLKRNTSRLGLSVALVLFAACGKGERAGSTPVLGRAFATPEAAVAAMVTAAERYDVAELKAILGPDGEDLVTSEDTVLDRNRLVAFAAEARQHQRLEFDSTNASAVLSVGAGDWPMPIPLVQQRGEWFFDVAEGKDEVLRRRIGQNELDAIDVCHTYVEAQRVYARARHDGARVNQYAQHVVSTGSKQNGLAWRVADGSWHGPMSEEIAGFIAEGYTDRQEPLHGYFFKVLKAQGPAAPMGELDFVVKGAMIGGFAMVAAPAEYGVTGIKTFIVSHDGIVYERDGGEESLAQFKAMERYNPDSTWRAVQDH